jgi:hypothetical protein
MCFPIQELLPSVLFARFQHWLPGATTCGSLTNVGDHIQIAKNGDSGFVIQQYLMENLFSHQKFKKKHNNSNQESI